MRSLLSPWLTRSAPSATTTGSWRRGIRQARGVERLRRPRGVVRVRLRANSEVDFLHLLVLFQIGPFALEHGAAGLQHVGVIGNVERKRDRLLGEQQGQPLFVQPV